MEKNGKKQEEKFPATLGGRMFSFGLQKISSGMKGISRLFYENNVAQRVSKFKNGSLRFSRELHRKKRMSVPLMQWRLSSEPHAIESAMTRRRTQPDYATGKQSTLQPALPPFIAPLPADSRGVSTRGSRNERNSKPLLKRPAGMHEDHRRTSNEGHPIKRDDNAREHGMVLPRPLLDVFSRLLRMRLPSVTVHQNSATDSFLRRRRADAMTVGSRIYFKTGAFDLKSGRGLGLLGHELTHVAQHTRGDQRVPAGGRSRELYEKTALANERFVLANASAPGVRSAVSNSAYRATPLPGASPAARPVKTNGPLFAESSREVNNFSPPAPEPATLSENDMMRIKEEVYRDLMMRIKVDFERGA